MDNSESTSSDKSVETLGTSADSETHAEHEEQGTIWLPALLGVFFTIAVVALLFAATLLAIRWFG